MPPVIGKNGKLEEAQAYLDGESKQISRLLIDGASQALSVPAADPEMRYFYLRLREEQREAFGSIKSFKEELVELFGEQNVPDYAVINHFLRYTGDGYPKRASLLNLVWLNDLLRDKLFKKHSKSEKLKLVGLGNGLPRNSIVPSLRVVSALRLERLRSQLQAKAELYREHLSGFVVDGDALMDDLVTHRTRGGVPEKKAFRVTTATAKALHKGLKDVAKVTRREKFVPAKLDDLFPLEVDSTYTYERERKNKPPRVLSEDYFISSKPRANRVLKPVHGNIIPVLE